MDINDDDDDDDADDDDNNNNSAEIQRHLAAWVVWKWRRPGPLAADQLF